MCIEIPDHIRARHRDALAAAEAKALATGDVGDWYDLVFAMQIEALREPKAAAESPAFEMLKAIAADPDDEEEDEDDDLPEQDDEDEDDEALIPA